MLLIIDNYDSFTFNLAQYFSELGQEVVVYRNNEVTVAEIATMQPDYLVISPGPCTPNEAGVSNEAIAYFAGNIPIFGVCLGHQCIGQVFGAAVVRAELVMHGKTAMVCHCGKGVFAQVDNPVEVVRYHSLVLDVDSLPNEFELTAWTYDNDKQVVMGMKHQTLAIESVQFHPESFLTQCGHKLLSNFLVRYAQQNNEEA